MKKYAISVVVFLSLIKLKPIASMVAQENPCPTDDPPVAAYDCCHADKDAVIQDCPSSLSCMNQANDPPPCTDGYMISADGNACVRSCNASDYSCMCLPTLGNCYNNSQIPPEGAGGSACCQGSDIHLSDLPHPEFWSQYLDDEPGVGECTLNLLACNYKNISDHFCCFDNNPNGTKYKSDYKYWGHGEPETGGVKHHGAKSMLLFFPDSSYDEDKGKCYDPTKDKHYKPIDTLCFKAP